MALRLIKNPQKKHLFTSLSRIFTACGKSRLSFPNGFAYAENTLGVASLFDLASVLRLRMALVGGKVLVPQLTREEKVQSLTDFNDIHQSRGLAEVTRQIGKGLQQKLDKGLSL